jgi:septal ring factor EnvC (AmiA/AmiB activator)
MIQPSPQQLLDAVEQQRNEAMNALATANATLAACRETIAALEAENAGLQAQIKEPEAADV